jgi:hypothetical protein
LIPPDDVALRFSLVAWPVLVAIWGLFVARPWWTRRKPSRAVHDVPGGRVDWEQ